MKRHAQPHGDYSQRMLNLGMSYDPMTIRLAHQRHEICAEETIERLEYTTREGMVIAGKMAVELAFSAANFDNASDWINRASNSFERATQLANTERLASTVADAKLSTAQLPLMAYLALFNQLPPTRLVEKAYTSTLEVAKEVSESFQQQARDSTPDAPLLLGLAAESAALLLGQRYALASSIDEGSWLPLHSLYSEDHANRAHHSDSRAWDITFYTDLGDGPQKSYLVQVKTSDWVHADARHTACIDGITQINFSPDLSFRSELKIAALATLDEMYIEASGDTGSSQNLEARTSKLLDLLDS